MGAADMTKIFTVAVLMFVASGRAAVASAQGKRTPAGGVVYVGRLFELPTGGGAAGESAPYATGG